MNLADLVGSGPLLVAAAVAALAGLVSFFAPCVLPLVPGYLSYITGLTGSAAYPARRRAVSASMLFVLGFTAVFTLLAYAAGEFGRALLIHARTIEIAAGALIIVLGLGFAGLPLPGLARSWRISRLPRAGLLSAPVLGATFALSWTPCLSPTLTVVLGLAAVQGSAGRGVILAAAYSLGMGLPFVAFALGYGRLLRLATRLRRRGDLVARAGGVLLVAVGLALVTGAWTEFINWLRITVGPGQIGI